MLSFLSMLWRILVNIPGFLIGVISTLVSFGILIGAYLWFFCCQPPKGPIEEDEERQIRGKLIKEWESPTSNSPDEAYRCGWVYIATEYQAHPPINLVVLQKLKHSNRSRPANVHFLILKHNSLFLYDSEEQTTCSGVAVIEGCKIDLYPHSLLLDEIYKKEFPLRIKKSGETLFDLKSTIYLYAATASEKEDWLFSLRQAATVNQQPKLNRNIDARFSPSQDPKLANAVFMERLNRYVRAPSMEKTTQWINALGGRLFFNMFRSNDLERYFRTKFDRKAAFTPKPSFLGDIVLKSVSSGQSLPMFSKGQLHSVTNHGELLISLDIFYPGGFRMQIETEIKLEIPKFKKLVVPVVMSIHVRRFSGRTLIRIKPPPSDRMWIGFYSPPHLEIDIEPVVSSKAVTWSVIKTAILKHVHDTMAEFIVLPNMDDFTIPPLIIGDCYGGEKPFEIDYIPPSILSQVRKHDLSATGLSLMPSTQDLLNVRDRNPSSSPSEPEYIDRQLLEGSHNSLAVDDLLGGEADLAMDPLESISTDAKKTPFEVLLEEAKMSDLLAQETRGKSSQSGSYAESTLSSASNEIDSTPPSPSVAKHAAKEVFISVKKSFHAIYKQSKHITDIAKEKIHGENNVEKAEHLD